MEISFSIVLVVVGVALLVFSLLTNFEDSEGLLGKWVLGQTDHIGAASLIVAVLFGFGVGVLIIGLVTLGAIFGLLAQRDMGRYRCGTGCPVKASKHFLADYHNILGVRMRIWGTAIGILAFFAFLAVSPKSVIKYVVFGLNAPSPEARLPLLRGRLKEHIPAAW